GVVVDRYPFPPQETEFDEKEHSGLRLPPPCANLSSYARDQSHPPLQRVRASQIPVPRHQRRRGRSWDRLAALLLFLRTQRLQPFAQLKRREAVIAVVRQDSLANFRCNRRGVSSRYCIFDGLQMARRPVQVDLAR